MAGIERLNGLPGAPVACSPSPSEAAERRPSRLLAQRACTARQRSKLERLARYVARPAIALERLSVDRTCPSHP
ncbi:MAG: hypothetical protein EXR87_07800 [Gammaproteobacteria bacterium]|nr:hypothetical protein [Gammaproteobacteria bacterium]